MTKYLEYLHFYISFVVLTNLSYLNASKNKHVTCGSVLKLQNVDYKIRLHSHDVKYGTGSGQQSVTGTDIQEDVNSHWAIWIIGPKVCERGAIIKCSDIIRLQHVGTGKNLHSHHFQSPLSGNQEISCYGEDGVGDSGDHWRVECSSDTWLRDYPIKLRHLDTDSYLSVSGRTFGRPISGQMEVMGTSNAYSGTEWRAVEGLFIHPNILKDHSNVHTEL